LLFSRRVAEIWEDFMSDSWLFVEFADGIIVAQ